MKNVPVLRIMPNNEQIFLTFECIYTTQTIIWKLEKLEKVFPILTYYHSKRRQKSQYVLKGYVKITSVFTIKNLLQQKT